MSFLRDPLFGGFTRNTKRNPPLYIHIIYVFRLVNFLWLWAFYCSFQILSGNPEMSGNLDLANCLPENERTSAGNERKLAGVRQNSFPIERVSS